MSCQAGCDKHIHSMKKLVGHFRRRIFEHNGHGVLGAFGEPGTGKSETMAMLLSQIQGEPLDVKRQVAFKPKFVKPMAQALPRFKAIQDDEASGEGGHKRQPMNPDNVLSVQDFDAMRGRNQITGLCAPKRSSLDSIKQGHLMWALELSGDQEKKSLVAWEGIKGSAMWQSETWWEERFSIERVPSLAEILPWGPPLRRDYLAGKENHMRGGSEDAVVRREALAEDFLAVARKELRALARRAE